MNSFAFLENGGLHSRRESCITLVNNEHANTFSVDRPMPEKNPELTAKQARLCRFVETYWDQNGIAPTLQEITDSLQLAGRSAAQQRVRLIARKGHLTYQPRRQRSIRLTDRWQEWKNRRLNRRTNPAVDRVFQVHPEKFAGWSETDWATLRSVRATGGQMSDETALREADKINENRQAKQLFAMLLEVDSIRDGLISWIHEKSAQVSPRNRKTRRHKK